jgi:hypothetical protein
MKRAAIIQQWNIVAEYCECEPQAYEERWPRVHHNVKMHFARVLAAMKTDVSSQVNCS